MRIYALLLSLLLLCFPGLASADDPPAMLEGAELAAAVLQPGDDQNDPQIWAQIALELFGESQTQGTFAWMEYYGFRTYNATAELLAQATGQPVALYDPAVIDEVFLYLNGQYTATINLGWSWYIEGVNMKPGDPNQVQKLKDAAQRLLYSRKCAEYALDLMESLTSPIVL